MRLTLLSAPSGDIETLANAKEHLTIDTATEDDRIQSYLDAAVAMIEADTNQCILSQSWREDFPCFQPTMRLSKSPITSASIYYYNASNVLTLINSSNYYVVNSPSPRIEFTYDYSYPETYAREDAIQITTVCSTTDTRVLTLAKMAQKILVSTWNEVREDVAMTSLSKNPQGYDRIINLIKRGQYIA